MIFKTSNRTSDWGKRSIQRPSMSAYYVVKTANRQCPIQLFSQRRSFLWIRWRQTKWTGEFPPEMFLSVCSLNVLHPFFDQHHPEHFGRVFGKWGSSEDPLEDELMTAFEDGVAWPNNIRCKSPSTNQIPKHQPTWLNHSGGFCSKNRSGGSGSNKTVWKIWSPGCTNVPSFTFLQAHICK